MVTRLLHMREIDLQVSAHHGFEDLGLEDMIIYSDCQIVRLVDATIAVPLISLAEHIRCSGIAFEDGAMKRGEMVAVNNWKVTNRVKGSFMDLKYFQISGHEVAAYEGTEEEAAVLQSQIVANLHTMCKDKNSSDQTTLLFDNNELDDA